MEFSRASAVDYFEDAAAKALVETTDVIPDASDGDELLELSRNPMEVYVPGFGPEPAGGLGCRVYVCIAVRVMKRSRPMQNHAVLNPEHRRQEQQPPGMWAHSHSLLENDGNVTPPARAPLSRRSQLQVLIGMIYTTCPYRAPTVPSAA
jgi:hypothetical protein